MRRGREGGGRGQQSSGSRRHLFLKLGQYVFSFHHAHVWLERAVPAPYAHSYPAHAHGAVVLLHAGHALALDALEGRYAESDIM